MHATRSFVQLSLSLLLSSSLLAACTSAQSPVSGSQTGISSSPGTASATSTSVMTLATELQGVTADDTTIQDAQKVDADFATLSERDGGRDSGKEGGHPGPGASPAAPAASGSPAAPTATGSAKPGLNPDRPAPEANEGDHRRFGLQVSTQARLDAARQKGKEMARQHKGELEASGAVKINDDGSVKIDPGKLREAVKKNIDDKRSRFEEMVKQNKDKLQNLKATAQNQIQGMRRKNNAVSDSDTVSTPNADGSVTKTKTVAFKNDKTGVSRNLTMSRTTKDNKGVGSEFDLKVTGPNGFTRSVHRVVTVNADGSRTSTTTAATVWGDGRKVERNESRTVGGDNAATGTGTVTITQKDGSSKTHTYTLGISAKGDATVESADQDEAKVTVEDQAGSATGTVVVEEKGKAATEETVDQNSDADAGAAA